MRNMAVILFFLVLCVIVWAPGSVMAIDKVNFEPARAPSKGPDNAPVTIIEIADFM